MNYDDKKKLKMLARDFLVYSKEISEMIETSKTYEIARRKIMQAVFGE